MAFELSCVRMRVRKISLLIGKRVLLTTGSSTMLGVTWAREICGMPRMLRAILSVTVTRSCDSTPVPATKPRSSGRISVTATPDGFCTPAVVQPARKAEPPRRPASRKREVRCMVSRWKVNGRGAPKGKGRAGSSAAKKRIRPAHRGRGRRIVVVIDDRRLLRSRRLHGLSLSLHDGRLLDHHRTAIRIDHRTEQKTG